MVLKYNIYFQLCHNNADQSSKCYCLPFPLYAGVKKLNILDIHVLQSCDIEITLTV